MRKFVACAVVGLAVFGGALVACSSSGSSGGSQQAFCDTLAKDKATFSDLSDQSDLNDSQSLKVVSTAFADLAKKAPSEIKADMDTLAKAVTNIAAVSKDFSSAAAKGNFSQLSSLEQSFSDQNKGLDQAEQNIEKFAKDKCNITLNSDETSSSSSSRKSSSSTSSDRSSLSDLSSDVNGLSDLSNLSDLSSLDSVLSDLSDLSSFTSN